MAERLRGAGLDDAQRKRLLREMNQCWTGSAGWWIPF